MQLSLPLIQNWSCHNCGGCCRQHAIEVTPEEKQRIEQQGWPGQPGFEKGQPIFQRAGGWPWKPTYQLAHRPDGACVFLDDRGLCRIHAKHGEAAKPLACRLYPYVFHPAGSKITVSLRFSCPSVVANRGKSLKENRSEIQQLEREVVPPGAEKIPPPEITRGQRLAWSDFHRVREQLDQEIANDGTPFVRRLLKTVFWTNLLGQARFEKIQGNRLSELLHLIQSAADAEVPQDLQEIPAPAAIARIQFRQLAGQYARKDTAAELATGWRSRWRMLQAAIAFTRGRGDTPQMQPLLKPVPFAALEPPFGPQSAEVEELFTRYFQVKIQGLHFCGRAYYDVPLVEGWHSLALIYPSVLWIARWIAVGENRTSLILEDVRRALAIADHHHGFSPAFGSTAFRRRVRLLAASQDLERLIAWYAQ